MQLPKGVWQWITMTQGSARAIAVELEKLRVLKEHELGVKVVRSKSSGNYQVEPDV